MTRPIQANRTDRTNPNYGDPLTGALRKKSKSESQRLLDGLHKAKMIVTPKIASETLLEYIKENDFPAIGRVRELIEQGAQIDVVDGEGKNALHHLVMKHEPDFQIYHALRSLESCDLDQRDKAGRSVFMLAQPGTVKTDLLLSAANQFQLNYSTLDTGETLLTQAAKDFDSELCQRLIKNGAEPNNGASALEAVMQSYYDYADNNDQIDNKVREQAVATALCLIDAGIDVNKVSSSSVRPLMDACRFNMKDVVVALLEKGADPNLLDLNADGPGHALMLTSDPEIAKLLIDAGANFRNCPPDFVEDAREFFENEEILGLLMDESLDSESSEALDIVDEDGNTLSHLAVQFAIDDKPRLLDLINSNNRFKRNEPNDHHGNSMDLIKTYANLEKVTAILDSEQANACTALYFEREFQGQKPNFEDFCKAFSKANIDLRQKLIEIKNREGESMLIHAAKHILNELDDNGFDLSPKTDDLLADAIGGAVDFIDQAYDLIRDSRKDPLHAVSKTKRANVYEMLSQRRFKQYRAKYKPLGNLVTKLKPKKGWFG